MPIYEYRCSACGHELESLQKLADAPLVTCPACGKETLTKLVSAAGFQLKGSGWYQTDFRAAAQARGAGQAGDPMRARQTARSRRKAPKRRNPPPRRNAAPDRPGTPASVDLNRRDPAQQWSRTMRRYLIAGLLVWVPLGITIWVLHFLVTTLDQTLLLMPEGARPDSAAWLPHSGIRRAALLRSSAV